MYLFLKSVGKKLTYLWILGCWVLLKWRLRNMKLIIIVCLPIMTISCSNGHKENSATNNELQTESIKFKNYDEPDTLVFRGEDIELSKIALSFYKWYIDYVNTPDTSIRLYITKGRNNKCTIKNLDNYINSLISIGTLTNKFIDSEYQRLLKCNQYLETYDWELYKSCTLYEVTDNTPCSCFTFYYWFNSQEPAHEAGIVNFQKQDSTLIVVIDFFFKDGYGNRNIQYFEATEYLIKKDNKWLIDEIKIE